ncbi:hypothetical protein BaRGS_00025822 [Batillaria attramentaria]|uniref:Major facilitator superfamily (MFS) profile domain-containing protein n=1 Tax=Batillaria attramentaria TaxID=370345 RepID=A0ABD0K727_9CAEN
MLCDEEATLTCKIHCKKPPPELCQVHDKQYDAVYVWMFFISLIANLAFSPVFSLADAATFDLLRDRPERYGKQRMWGTVGFALFAIASTFAMYFMTQQGSQTNYTVSFYIFAVLCCCATLIAYFLDLSAAITCGGNMLRHFCALVSHPQVLVFLVVVLYFGMVTGVLEGFLFIYLHGLGAEPLVFGFSLVINCLFEVPLLFLSGIVIKRIGAVFCLYIALVALAIRMLGYSLLGNPWVVLVIEPLHGVTFGVMWAAATTHAAAIAPAGMSATIQGLVGGIHFGIGKGIGSIVTGFMFDQLGRRTTFHVYAGVTVGLLVFYAILNQFVFKSHTQAARPQADRKRKGVDGSADDMRENNGYPLLSAASDSTDRQSDKDIDASGEAVGVKT